MRCQICGADTRVLRTIEAERRRECVRCKHRFTTVEQMKEKVQRIDGIIREAREFAEMIIAESR